MEIKDKKLVSVLVGIIILLSMALGALYLSTPQGGPPRGTPPTGMRGGNMPQNSTGTDTNTGTTDNVTDPMTSE